MICKDADFVLRRSNCEYELEDMRMVQYKLEVSKQELDTLIEMQLQSPGNKKRRKFSRILFTIAMILMLYLIVRSIQWKLKQYTVLCLVLFAFMAWFTTVGLYTCQKLILKKAQGRLDKRATSGEIEYEFDEDGVVIRNGFSYGEMQWDAFKEWGTFKDYIYLKLANEQIILIKKDVLPEEDKEELIALLMENVKLAEN